MNVFERIDKMDKNDEIFLQKLTVDTLKVYNYLLKHNPNEVTLEQLSSALNLSKPTILHHLDKLKSLDIVEQTIKGYKVKEVVKIAVVKGYARQFKKFLVTWFPLSFIFLVLGFISFMVITPIELKILSLFLCSMGFLISIIEIKQLL
jgi:DNA-binding transcriptional ArsR family regulator